MKLSREITNWLKAQADEAGKKGAVFGLSGGLDSAVVGVLCKRAFGKNALGIILPCMSIAGDEKDAVLVAEKFDIPVKKIDLTGIYKQLAGICEDPCETAAANLKPRLRMTVLYYFANNKNYLVAGTGNKSELMTGYFTKYGDGGADMLPLGDLLKTEVRRLAKELGIPEEIISKPPSAGLWEGQTDEKEMGVTYEELDKTISAIEINKTAGLPEKLLQKIGGMIKNTEHKRRMPPVFKKNG